jgi:xeroderma pigmentosum group C-complementing protein
MKLGKVRASTINRQRALEVAGDNEGEGNENGVVTQGMYAESQTELYVPPPVQDVSLFVPRAHTLDTTPKP